MRYRELGTDKAPRRRVGTEAVCLGPTAEILDPQPRSKDGGGQSIDQMGDSAGSADLAVTE